MSREPAAHRTTTGGEAGRAVHVLIVLPAAEEREELCRRLSHPEFGLTLFSAADFEQARPLLQARELDALVGDSAALAALRAKKGTVYEDARWLPFCLLLLPGQEEQAADFARQGSAEIVLPATGDYYRLIPPLLRRAIRRRETSWEEVARVIRHEVNNPLTGILGNAELILAGEKAISAKTRERLNTIIDLAVRLRDVVGTLEKRLRGNGNPANGSIPSGDPPSRSLTREVVR